MSIVRAPYPTLGGSTCESKQDNARISTLPAVAPIPAFMASSRTGYEMARGDFICFVPCERRWWRGPLPTTSHGGALS
jgi:hypothetical protein